MGDILLAFGLTGAMLALMVLAIVAVYKTVAGILSDDQK